MSNGCAGTELHDLVSRSSARRAVPVHLHALFEGAGRNARNAAAPRRAGGGVAAAPRPFSFSYPPACGGGKKGARGAAYVGTKFSAARGRARLIPRNRVPQWAQRIPCLQGRKRRAGGASAAPAQSNTWFTIPSASFGSNHVLFGGMIPPASATAIKSSICVG